MSFDTKGAMTPMSFQSIENHHDKTQKTKQAMVQRLKQEKWIPGSGAHTRVQICCDSKSKIQESDLPCRQQLD